MSLLPFMLVRDAIYDRPSALSRFCDWDDFIIPDYSLLPINKEKQLRKKPRSECYIGKNGFQVSINVERFQPNEISVKTIDNMLVIEGKHEDRPDEYGYISRNFVRKFALPKDCDPKDVVSSLSSDGILTINAPLQKSGENKTERIIQIQQTGQAHSNTNNQNEKSDESTNKSELTD